MDFDLPDTALAVRDGVAAVAAKYDHAYWSRCEEEKRYPTEAYRDLAEGGWLGLSVPEEYGGGGQGLLETAIACETLCASGGTAGSFFYVLNPGFGVTTLARHGTEEQKQEILPGLASGDIQFSFGLTEPDAGSNAIEISTSARARRRRLPDQGPEGLDLQRRARRLDGGGHPHHPGRGGKPRTAGFTLFLVDVKEALAAGTLSYTPIPKMGSNILYSSQVFFDDVRVPAHRVLGEVDEGFRVLWDVLNPERIIAAAGGVGGADAALQVASDYARERVVFGRPIGANQSISFPLAQIKAKTELARLMVYKAAWLFDQGRPCGSEANVAKLTASQAAWEAADQAFQTLGGMAYSKEYPVERMFRDARIGKNIPVSEQMVLAHIGTSMLDLPKTY